MPPGHNPEIRDALPPASLDQVDGMATRTISRQLRNLEAQIGNVDRARIPGRRHEPLYGYDLELDDGTQILLEIERDADGNIIEADQEFIDARNRLAVLRSRERSRGSRMFNFSFLKNRGRGPGTHGYQLDDITNIQEQYDEQLSEFIARKVEANSAITDDVQATETVSRAVIQEQRQMSTLEHMAAEMKSGNRFMNFLRNHRGARVAAGLALTGAGVLGVMTGQLEIAIPAFASRAALSGTGGYLLGRTGWDGVQGWQSRRLPEDDIRMASGHNGDFSGRIHDPEQAFERFTKINGAEARAESGLSAESARRQRLARTLGANLVNQYYSAHIAFPAAAKPNLIEIYEEVYHLHGATIRPMEDERLASDQTQSRARHIAGLVVGGALAAIPLLRAVGGAVDALAHSSNIHDSVTSTPDTTSPSSSPDAAAGQPMQPVTPDTAGATPPPASPDAPSVVPSGTPEVTINGGPGNDTIIIGGSHFEVHTPSGSHATGAGETGSHGVGGDHGANGDHNIPHETPEGLVGSKLHVEPGGGFISTLQDQYDLTPAQATSSYHAMYHDLLGAKGTYMEGSDIRISAPGDFKLPEGARSALEEHLRSLHGTADQHVPHGVPENVDPQTGGVTASSHAHGAGTSLPDTQPNIRAFSHLFDTSHFWETGTNSVSGEEAVHAHRHIAEYMQSHQPSNLSSEARSAISEYAMRASADQPPSWLSGDNSTGNLQSLFETVGREMDRFHALQAETAAK